MKIIEVSPFVRFAYKIMLKSTSPCIAMDCRLFYVLDGEGTFTIDNIKYNISPGTLVLFQAGTEYFLTALTPVTMVSINFDFTCENIDKTQPLPLIYINTSKPITKPKQINFEDCPFLNYPVVLTGNSSIYSLLEKILFESTSQRLYYTEKISALLKNCIINIVRGAASANDSRADNALEAVMEYIHKNYNLTVDNGTLAELVGYHPYYLNKLFTSANGITLHKYVANYLIAVAEQLLLSTTQTIDEIALAIGFSTPLSFSSSFKKKHGITPTEFRKRFGVSNG